MHLDHAMVLTNLAACALNKKPSDPSTALLRLRPVLSALPKHVKARLRAGRCCVLLGELNQAITHYEVALRAEKPEAPKEGIQLRYTPPINPATGNPDKQLLLSHDGKTPLSELAQQAVEGKANATRLLSHCERTRTLAAAGRVDEALYLARSVCRGVTHATLGIALLVRTLEGAGRLWEAQQEAEEGIESFQDDEPLGVAYARVLARRGKVVEAEAKLSQLIRTRPGEECRAQKALRGLKAAVRCKADGNNSYAKGEYERAAAQYTEGIDADVEGCLRPILLANRAQARLQEGRHAEALSDCDEAILWMAIM